MSSGVGAWFRRRSSRGDDDPGGESQRVHYSEEDEEDDGEEEAVDAEQVAGSPPRPGHAAAYAGRKDSDGSSHQGTDSDVEHGMMS